MAYVLVLAGWVLTFFVGTIRFSFYGVEFKFKAFIPMLGGVFITAPASFLRVGGSLYPADSLSPWLAEPAFFRCQVPAPVKHSGSW